MNFLIDESSRYYFWQSAFRRFCRDRLALLGSVILLIIILGVTIGPWIYQTPIDKIDFSQMAALPSWQHTLGTNDLGQDQLARLLVGGRISLAVGITAMAVAMIL